MAYGGYECPEMRAHYFNQSVATPAARKRMRRLLELGGHTGEFELVPGGAVERRRDLIRRCAS